MSKSLTLGDLSENDWCDIGNYRWRVIAARDGSRDDTVRLAIHDEKQQILGGIAGFTRPVTLSDCTVIEAGADQVVRSAWKYVTSNTDIDDDCTDESDERSDQEANKIFDRWMTPAS